jgi:hypothetical protein
MRCHHDGLRPRNAHMYAVLAVLLQTLHCCCLVACCGPVQFFAECGWRLLVRYSATQATHVYGWELMGTPHSRVKADSQQVQYVVGVRL